MVIACHQRFSPTTIYFNNKAEIIEEIGRNDEAEAAYNDAITLCERTSPKGKTCRNVKENHKNLQRKMSALEKEGAK